MSPSSPAPNQTTTATFTVKNTGGQAITAQAFVAGARDPSNANVDFPGTGAVTLQPGQQYSYSASRSFTATGTYTAWPAWWDGTNWYQLASPTTFTVANAPPGTISLVTSLALSPSSPAPNQTTTATFTVKNTGGQAITAQAFVAGARNPSNANVDFPATGAVTLQPGQQYSYSASRSFAAGGNYTAWPAWWDGTNWYQLAAPATFTVANSPGHITLVTALNLSPASPAAGQSTTATFTVQNTGGQAITAQSFVAGARDPNNANVDFPATAPVTLQPGAQYTYSQSRSFTPAGSYSAWPSWWDGTNWYDLDVHTSFTVGGGGGGASCTLPWGGTIADGQSTTAYQSSQATCGNACVPQTRTCTNGTLSGSYTNQTCAPPSGCGTTKTVKKDGTGDYTTISAAAAAAQPGYEIQIYDGTYTELVAPPTSGSSSGGYITFRAVNTGNAIITNSGGPCIDVSGKSYLKFIGLALNNCTPSVTGYSAELSGAIQIRDGSHHIVADTLSISNSDGSGVYIFGTGTSTNRVHDVTVQNSSISHSVNHGILIYRGADYITADNNAISDSGRGDILANAYGIEIRDEDDNYLNHEGQVGPSYIRITNNDAGYSSYQGSRTWNVNHVLFQGNHFHHSGATGIQIEKGTTYCMLDGNHVEHNSWTGHYKSETGIWIDRTTDCVVQNNRANNNNIGIWVGAGNNRILVRNNMSYTNDGSNSADFPEGLRINGDTFPNTPKGPSSNVTVVHNTLYKNGNTNDASTSFNLVLEVGEDVGNGQYGSNNVAYNNIVSDVVAGTNVDESSGYTVSNGCYWNPAVAAPGDGAAVLQDPQYVDPTASTPNFQLQAGSACVDHGKFLTTATAAGTNSSTLTVADGRYFIDGYGLTSGDAIMVGSQQANIVHVSGNTLTLDRTLTWAAGATVTYPYLGAAPDIGAVESH